MTRAAGIGVGLAAVVALGAAASLFALPQERSIGSYSTTLEGRSRSQRHNALLAVARLDGAVIKPGEEFSFNGRIGTFSRDQGYRKAPVSYNGQLIDSFGGGVCQCSTTLYNAALLAGMEITERNRHRFAPGYVPPGRDAAVAYYNIDLKFRNPHEFPVRIRATLQGDRLAVQMLGTGVTKPIEVVSDVTAVKEPPVFRLGDEQGPGRVRNTGKPGFFVRVFRLRDGRRELISADTYPAMGIVIDRRQQR